MTAIRRIYAYLICLAGLVMLAGGLANVMRVLLDVALRTSVATSAASPERYLREGISGSAAAALVGLPVWVLHWRWVQAGSRTQVEERTSTLRALYLYVVLALALLAGVQAAGALVRTPLELMERGRLDLLAGGIPFFLVALAVWLYHWRVAAADRARSAEPSRTATRRRWYLYGAAFLGFVFLLGATRNLVESLWVGALDLAGTARPIISTARVPQVLVALGAWVLHWVVLPCRLEEPSRSADEQSTPRHVYLFLGLAVAVVATLAGASQLLYYALARSLGVERPGGVGGDLLQAAAGPASMVLVFGMGWLYQRAAIRAQAAAAQQAPRQIGIQRLYVYVVVLVALAALYGGVIRLLWTLVDVALGSGQPLVTSSRWRDDVAVGATLVAVGLPVWLGHWRPSGAAVVTPDEAGSLSRRLYAYLALIGAMLSLVGGAAGLVYRLFDLLLGGDRSASLVTDLAHALAVAVVAAVVAVYHWRTIRADSERARAVSPSPPAVSEVTLPAAPRIPETVVRLRAPDQARLDDAIKGLRAAGVAVEVMRGNEGV